MYRYRNTQSVRIWIPDAGVEVEPGEEFDSPVELNNPTLEPVKAASKSKEVRQNG